jgi:hypothetical protein
MRIEQRTLRGDRLFTFNFLIFRQSLGTAMSTLHVSLKGQSKTDGASKVVVRNLLCSRHASYIHSLRRTRGDIKPIIKVPVILIMSFIV